MTLFPFPKESTGNKKSTGLFATLSADDFALSHQRAPVERPNQWLVLLDIDL
jgi:hypothetical protein